MSSVFIESLNLSSKTCAFFNGNLLEEFFRLIVVLDKDALYLLFYSICSLMIYWIIVNKYGVNLDSQYCCGGLFFLQDDIVLVVPI